METIRQSLEAVGVADPQRCDGLIMFPLVVKAAEDPLYITLDDAIKSGSARVGEISEGGSVPRLTFVNDGDRPVLLLDGEELVGAKQNRVLNLTILVPAHTTIEIPVSCVERGRWSRVSAHFRPAGRVLYQSGRARQAMQVSESLACNRVVAANQGAIWNDIDRKMHRMELHSRTGAISDLYEDRSERLDDYVRSLTWVERQAGAAFALRGRLTGIELFDAPATMRRVLPKIVRSHALDALDAPQRRGPRPASDELTPKDVQAFVTEVANASAETYPAVGLGQTVRLSAPGLSGGALVVEESIVHLAAFRVDGQSDTQGAHDRSARLVRASRRWRSH